MGVAKWRKRDIQQEDLWEVAKEHAGGYVVIDLPAKA